MYNILLIISLILHSNFATGFYVINGKLTTEITQLMISFFVSSSLNKNVVPESSGMTFHMLTVVQMRFSIPYSGTKKIIDWATVRSHMDYFLDL